jgi:hypothetical protein
MASGHLPPPTAPGCFRLPIPPTHPIRARPAPSSSPASQRCISPARPQQHLHLRLPPAPTNLVATLRRCRPCLLQYFHSPLHRHTHPISTSSTPPRSIDVDFPRYSRLSTLDRPPSSLAATLVFVSRKSHSLRFHPFTSPLAPRFNRDINCQLLARFQEPWMTSPNNAKLQPQHSHTTQGLSRFHGGLSAITKCCRTTLYHPDSQASRS